MYHHYLALWGWGKLPLTWRGRGRGSGGRVLPPGRKSVIALKLLPSPPPPRA